VPNRTVMAPTLKASFATFAAERTTSQSEPKYGESLVYSFVPRNHLMENPRAAVSFHSLREENMAETDRIKYLRLALLVVGLIFVVGIYPLTIIWPSGWSWHVGQSDYLQMILGIYATLGVFLLVASRNPLAHFSLIWFTVWSSIVHGGIMAVQSVANPEHLGHLWGDVLALFVVAAVLALLTPRGAAAKPA
jgi:hypothetical protein